jgi:hypothetical protein
MTISWQSSSRGCFTACAVEYLHSQGTMLGLTSKAMESFLTSDYLDSCLSIAMPIPKYMRWVEQELRGIQPQRFSLISPVSSRPMCIHFLSCCGKCCVWNSHLQSIRVGMSLIGPYHEVRPSESIEGGLKRYKPRSDTVCREIFQNGLLRKRFAGFSTNVLPMG